MQYKTFCLTQEQKELAEKNYALVWAFLTRNHLDPSEYHGSACLGLCRAAANYDEDKCDCFSTFAYRCMGSQAHKHAMYLQRKIRSGEKYNLSLDAESDGDQSLLDLVEAPAPDLCDHANLRAALEALQKKNAVWYEIFVKNASGYSLADIARDLGTSNQNVQQKRAAAIRFLKKKLEENDERRKAE